MTTTEALNNAIVRLGYLSANTASVPNPDVRYAVRQLADHWAAWWSKPERTLLPAPTLQGKLERYAQWYARAWALVPANVRKQVPKPGDIDPTWDRLTGDWIRGIEEGSSASAAVISRVAKQATGFGLDVGMIALLVAGAWFLLRKGGK